jgi:hypothetical protein
MISSANAGFASYTLSGGKIDGTLNGVSFALANFTITADVDPSNFVSGTYGGAPLLSQPGVSTMTIDGLAAFQITSANFGPVLVDLSFMAPGFGFGGFGLQRFANDLQAIGATGPLSSLASNVTVTGDLAGSTGFTFTTTAGDLMFTNTSGTATFNGDFPTVPEPTSITIFGLGALCLAYRARRKLKT